LEEVLKFQWSSSQRLTRVINLASQTASNLDQTASKTSPKCKTVSGKFPWNFLAAEALICRFRQHDLPNSPTWVV
jgi:hypothetical protein